MQTINVKIKLVIFGISFNSLGVFVHDGLLPSANIANEISLEKQVEDIFLKTTGRSLENNYVEQLYTISNNKDEIIIVYFVLLPLTDIQQNMKPGWTTVAKLQSKSADKNIIAYALQRLQWKIEYTNVVYSLLPKEFTLSELQKTYEAILGQILDKRNFRKKIQSLHFLEPTGKKRVGVTRPAQMYSFKKRTPTMVKIFS